MLSFFEFPIVEKGQVSERRIKKIEEIRGHIYRW